MTATYIIFCAPRSGILFMILTKLPRCGAKRTTGLNDQTIQLFFSKS